ncbi:hypothetical protein J2X12_003473 [Pseudarthrobacter oxydans]|uniref:Uncharacterized protein n=1 Tax=Pseudarthrobacter oxydans TaxID=1671 RepID=A0AAW8NFR9_PSEOX|nr:hypothetical protein [Pseudarthrobacter oxydans]MDR6794198.1 hypothetical protein [Pseudarthrobacter oxydans]MDR7165424.1 hypothetical protein [Pseudarthrobacter oxydans]
MGELIQLHDREREEPTKSLSLELRLEARKLDGYQELGPTDLVAKAEHYLELEQTDLTPRQRQDVESILSHVLGEMELRDAEGVRR